MFFEFDDDGVPTICYELGPHPDTAVEVELPDGVNDVMELFSGWTYQNDTWTFDQAAFDTKTAVKEALAIITEQTAILESTDYVITRAFEEFTQIDGLTGIISWLRSFRETYADVLATRTEARAAIQEARKIIEGE